MKRNTVIVAGVILVLGAMTQFMAAKSMKEKTPGKSIEGVWKGQVHNGATGHKLTISDKTIKGIKDGKKDLGEGTYTLNTSVTPWTLDVVGTKGGSKGSNYHGICKVEGDVLTWQTGTESKKRPKKFKGSDGFCLILKKQ